MAEMSVKKVAAKKTSKKTTKPVGRPSTFTEAVAQRICTELSEGKSLRTICLAENMPDRTTVFDWLAKNGEFANQYARAREAQADKLAEEIIEIADDGRNDTYMTEEGVEMTDHDVIARSKLRVDARKWYASKLAPRKYGDKMTLGGDSEAPLVIIKDLTGRKD